MARDIDYAAIAVNKAIVEKFGRKTDLKNLSVAANDRTISVHDEERTAEGTRDELLAAVRSRLLRKAVGSAADSSRDCARA